MALPDNDDAFRWGMSLMRLMTSAMVREASSTHNALATALAGSHTHELQRLGGWRTASMVERYAHLASDHLAESAARLGNVVAGYDLATVAEK